MVAEALAATQPVDKVFLVLFVHKKNKPCLIFI